MGAPRTLVALSVAIVPLAQADVLPPPRACAEAAGLGEQPVLLTVLSPRMVSSISEWPRMKSVARTLGLAVVAWRSPWVSEAEWRASVERAGWPADEAGAIDAVPLPCRAWVGHPNHFPYSVIVEGGRTHPWPIWGVLPDPAWVASLGCRRQALQGGGGGCGP